MELAETFFIDGEPIGQICLDSFAGIVTFKPRAGHERLAAKKWPSVRGCKKAVIRAYKKEPIK